ncbi:MAG: Pyruvate-flavodoxin oxidoreductase [Candidatus Omnitrophica bacterium]|nr:Pyruvate-flavodoxin oxidoreductase [Candidatus Omnitrophota bacterium]
MTKRLWTTIDGNEAAALIAYKLSEVIAIYPITPSTTMAELAEAWAVQEKSNLWGVRPVVRQMQSEGGAAGTCHGALQTGALTTTFTASQGLLLMIPNMYKIAGELTSAVFHVAARSIARQGLSIFGDHSDLMAVRQTGWAILVSASVQEAHDLALVAHAATLRTRVPFVHAFDGFRTSHEVMKIEELTETDIRSMIDEDSVREHRLRALSPERPFVRGTSHNPDVAFQAQESCNPYYAETPAVVRSLMERLAQLTGRRYGPFDYEGDPEADRVVVIMGSGAQTVAETVGHLRSQGHKVGVLTVRLYRPFDTAAFIAALPRTVRSLAVLDRSKEPGAAGEALYADTLTALYEHASSGGPRPRVIGGRYGLSSKEFTPAMAKAVFDELSKSAPKNHFTVGIHDDVSGSSLDYDPDYRIEPEDETRAIFWGLGSDGTVGANKNSIKIIGEMTDLHAQGYFVYDSKKSGSVTVSHLRFGQRPIRSPYLVQRAGFVAVHQFGLAERYPVLDAADEGAIFLLNSPVGPEEVWGRLPADTQRQALSKKVRFYVIDGYGIAKRLGIGGRINTIMQTAFFVLSGILPRDKAVEAIKKAIRKTYGKRGEAVVQKNMEAVDAALDSIRQVTLPAAAQGDRRLLADVPARAPEFVRQVTAEMMFGRGDTLPVSALPIDGTYPSATSQWEKRDISQEVPVWEQDLCIQCGKCVLVCPHAVIRSKIYEPSYAASAPASFKSVPAKWRETPDRRYTLQVSVQDCTGCAICVEVCPVKDRSNSARKAINMAPKDPVKTAEMANWDHFLSIPDITTAASPVPMDSVKNVQVLRPLFEFSGACAGCGETPYLKLVSQLFGDRALIANATGCSSIYGGNLPTTPWAVDAQGRGPAWSNSLFEDNAEFGLGYRIAVDQHRRYALKLLSALRDRVGGELADALVGADTSTDAGIAAQRERIAALKRALGASADTEAKDLLAVADALSPRSVWIVGGDGWAYDIGYGGLDHVLASGENVNVLVLDTEVYSNTGGQASKSTSRGAVAKFAAGGKESPKKDLGLLAMSYGHVYVAQVAMGASDSQTLRALQEAESYPGPSLVIAYSHCIAHGIDMRKGMSQQKMAVESGYWPIYRYDPRRSSRGDNPFQLDCRQPTMPLKAYLQTETRFRILEQSDRQAYERLMDLAERDRRERWQRYERMAAPSVATAPVQAPVEAR